MGAATRFVQNPGNNAICYYRYSSDAQRDVSIVQQKDAAHEYAKAHGCPERWVEEIRNCCIGRS